MTDPLDIDLLQTWIGRTETHDDLMSPWTASALAATLRNDDQPWPAGRALPPLWHWCYFLPTSPQIQLGPDGHPARGGFLPPVPLPRRMWAASRLEFVEPLRVGDTVTRRSQITDVQLKEGRKLVLMVRETPLHKGHLELMARAADCGAVILPPMPAFYHRPTTIMDLVHQSIGKALDQVGIEHDLFRRWSGRHEEGAEASAPVRLAT